MGLRPGSLTVWQAVCLDRVVPKHIAEALQLKVQPPRSGIQNQGAGSPSRPLLSGRFILKKHVSLPRDGGGKRGPVMLGL